MLHVGITGGIGSGKSTVARIFATLGVPVYFADDETRRLMNTDPVIRAALVKHFGPEAYTDKGLNRGFIASKVFNDPEQLVLLNSITHPPTITHAKQWMESLEGAAVPFTLKEAALLFESGSVRDLDFVIGVYSPEALRVKRIMDRDAISAEEVRQRMDRQLDESIKMRLCDAVLVNDETKMLIPQVLELFGQLVNKKPAVG
ncbi:MAG: dephospho-CoA kinase [Chitinophagaceae bacterium]|nr:MAG: dephospho-CoA kinase [Chitinophagaceae bacterium]